MESLILPTIFQEAKRGSIRIKPNMMSNNCLHTIMLSFRPKHIVKILNKIRNSFALQNIMFGDILNRFNVHSEKHCLGINGFMMMLFIIFLSIKR